MNPVTRRATLAHIQVTGSVQRAFARVRSDRGQGTLEYVGIVLAVIALCGVVAMFLKTEVGAKISKALSDALGQIGIGGGSGDEPGP